MAKRVIVNLESLAMPSKKSSGKAGGMLYQEQAYWTVARSIGRRRTSLMLGHVALGSGLWRVRA